MEYCGRQGIALRGHRDDGFLSKHDHEDENQGNFRLMAGLDKNLENFTITCKRNATYFSKTSQNQLFLCIKEYIQQEIVNSIKDQKDGSLFSLSPDEVTDASNREQLGIIVRYVKKYELIERLLEFVSCEDIKGKCICNYLVKTRQDSGLHPKICRS